MQRTFPRFPVALAAVVALAVGSFPSDTSARELLQRYVTTWSPEVQARLLHPESHEVNAVRYRLREGERRDSTWWECRVISVGRLLPHGGRPWDDPRPSWNAPVSHLEPGDYETEFDLRTPQEGIFIETHLRVPQIARFLDTENADAARALSDLHREHGRLAVDGALVLTAWDTDHLYLIPASEVPGSKSTDRDLRLSLDLLPVDPGKHTEAVTVSNDILALPWSSLGTAGPHLGQVLRMTVSDLDGNTLQESDLLLVGSGLPIHFSSNMVAGPPGHDDQGPPRELLNSLYRMSGFNEEHTGSPLEKHFPTEPERVPEEFDFSDMLSNPSTYYDGLVVVGVGNFVEWMRDREYEEEIWPPLEAYAEELARTAASLGLHTYSTSYNEPELFYRSDNRKFFVNNLKHFAEAIRRGDPEAQIMAGNFSAGDPAIIRSFVTAGMRDYFDILNIHPYSNDPKTGQDHGGVVASHEELEALGIGDRRIYLGEGWGPTRNLHQKVRVVHDEPVSFEEADYMRQFFWNGYRCMVTPRDDYNPEWVFGAKFFTLNDNLGMTYWKHNAIPKYNELGEIEYYLLSHLRFDDVSEVTPDFFNGGLIDFYARPKGDWYFDFPPSLPQIRVQAEPEFDYLLPDEEGRLTVKVINADDRPFEDVRIGFRSRTYGWRGDLVADTVESTTRASLAPGETWTFTGTVEAINTIPSDLRIAVEVDYQCEGTTYIGDDIVRTEVREPVAVQYEPAHVTLTEPGETYAVEVTVQNNRQEKVQVEVPGEVGQIKVAADKRLVVLQPGESSTFELAISATEFTPGVKDLTIYPGSFEAVTVASAMSAGRVADAPTIDGDLSDWPKMDDSASISLGDAIGLAERPTWIPFPVPEPPAKSAFDVDTRIRDEQVAADRQLPQQFAAQGGLTWDRDHLYVALWVEDPKHVQDNFGLEMWRGDSIQLALDPENNGVGDMTVTPGEFRHRVAEENYGPDDFEITIGLTRTGPQMVYTKAPFDYEPGPVAGVALEIQREADMTVYEMAIPWEAIGIKRVKAGKRIGFDLLVNNFDGTDRAIVGLADAIGAGKYPSRFLDVVLERH